MRSLTKEAPKGAAALLDGARRMNEDALVEIFELYAPAVYKYVLTVCNDAMMADHIVGDTFAKLLENLSAGKGPNTNLRAYLYEMAYHLVVDEARKSHRSVPIEVVDLIHHDKHSTYASMENRMLLESIRGAIRSDLTEDQRQVVILRFLEGFSIKQTAAVTGKKVGTVKAIQNRAVAALRKVLDYRMVETSAPPLAVGDD